MLYRYFISLLCLFVLSTTLYAQTIVPANNQPAFDPTQANRTLDTLSIKLSIQKLNVKHLQDAITVLTGLQAGAKQCITQYTNQLNDINTRLDISHPRTQMSKTEYDYLVNKKQQYTQQLSDCRLFMLRSTEAVTAFSSTVQKLLTIRLLKKEPDLITNIEQTPKSLDDIQKSFSRQAFITNFGNQFLTPPFLSSLAFGILFAFIAGLWLRWLINKHINQATQISKPYKTNLLIVCRRYCLLLLPLIVLSLFMGAISLNIFPDAASSLISYTLLAYCLALIVISFFFDPPSPAKKFNNLPEKLSKAVAKRLRLLMTWLLIGITIYSLIKTQPLPIALLHTARSLFIIILAINLISLTGLITRLPKLVRHHHILRIMIACLLVLMLLVIMGAEGLGYHQLTDYLVVSIVFSIIASFIAWLFYKISNLALKTSHYQWQHKLRNLLGLKASASFPELMWLRISAYSIIWGGLIVTLLKVWGLDQAKFNSVINVLLHGFQLGQLTIIPPRIVLAMILFALFIGTTRFIRTQLIKKAKYQQNMQQLDAAGREAIATILGYVGFSLSTILVLLIAGVNFAGLAIITGALSVGIGFGLQNIVSNFISGIILLIERPVKTGDRIQVGDTEGYVRKISIRSTHIKTLQQADVIVPNSDLITKQVTNLTLYDAYWRVTIKIGVAYGSDTALVSKLMMDIANRHPEILQGENAPQVYFEEFGDSSLNFSLICTVRDVNIRSLVKSQLNFEIDQAFREHHIEIPFPQRDITIKNIGQLVKGN